MDGCSAPGFRPLIAGDDFGVPTEYLQQARGGFKPVETNAPETSARRAEDNVNVTAFWDLDHFDERSTLLDFDLCVFEPVIEHAKSAVPAKAQKNSGTQ